MALQLKTLPPLYTYNGSLLLREHLGGVVLGEVNMDSETCPEKDLGKKSVSL